MSKIERGQFSNLLRRYLGMSGDYHVADELSPEVSPGFTLEQERPEWEFLKGQKLLSSVCIIPASGGLASAARLRNPAGTNAIGIVTQITVSTEAGAPTASRIRVTVNNDAGNLTTTVASYSRDTRYPRAAFPGNSALISSFDYGLNGDSILETSIVLSTPLILFLPIVITPAFQLQVTNVTVNVATQVSFAWLEKRLDPLEAQ